MFDKKYEDRLQAWADFRSVLEDSDDPIQDVIDYYNRAPLSSISVDPYDEEYWPDPWALIYHNDYCEFAIILGIAYTLQLTTRFSNSCFEIHICTDIKRSEVKYLLTVDNKIIGYDRNFAISVDKLPQDLITEKKYSLKSLQ
jgi:hypothetical protein